MTTKTLPQDMKTRYGVKESRTQKGRFLLCTWRECGWNGVRSARSVLRYAAMIVVMLVVGVNSMWGQATDYSGTYYIASDYQNANDKVTRYYDFEDNTKNFYLCPTEGWISYKASSPNWETGDAQPFLTTYKIYADDNYDKTKAKWSIEYYATISGTDYYYIKNSYGQYMVLNNSISAVSGSNKALRIRVHLETLTSEQLAVENKRNMALFAIYPERRSIIISPKTQSNYHLTVNKGNGDSLQGENRNSGGTITSGDTTYGMSGTIGIYDGSNDDSQYLYLEDCITRPTISFNESDQVVITAVQTGATLVYTTDGTPPTASNGTAVNSNTVTISPADGVTTIKAIAIVNDEVSNVATTAVLTGSTHPYLIQNLGFDTTSHDGFYMLPGAVVNNEITVNTSSLARPSMRWYFKLAGVIENSQYFYIYNTGNDGNEENYLFCNSSGNVYLKPSNAFVSASDDFKFRLLGDASTGYRIEPKSYQNNWLQKGGTNSNNASDYVSTKGKDDFSKLQCRWNIIPVFNNEMPAALRPSPFNVTTSSGAAYYKIGNAAEPNAFIIPGTTYATTSATDAAESNDMKWYMLEAESDDWLTYYHIVNAVTGKYLYYNKDAEPTQEQTDALITQELSTTNADRYQFVVAKTTESASGGKYYIVPKVLKYRSNNLYWLVRRDGTKTLRVNEQRADGGRKWTFTSTAINVVAPPVVSFDNSTRELSFNAIPSATIYYSTDGNEPATEYDPNNKPTLDFGPVYTVNAKAQLGAVTSETASLEVDLSLVRPTIVIAENEPTGKATITISTPQAGVPIYYTTNGSTPTTSNGTLYSAPFEVDMPAEGESLRITAVAINVVSGTTYTSDPEVGTIGGEDFSGLYYIQSNQSTGNYLNVSSTKDSNNNPYATTNTTQNISAVWQIVRQGDYYQIIHYNDNKYLTATPDATTNSAFLSASVSDNALFEITRDGDQVLIKAKNADNTDGKNNLYYNGTNPIQLGASSAGQSKWNLLSVPPKPWASRTDIIFSMGAAVGDIYYTIGLNPNETAPTKTAEHKYDGTFQIEYGPQYHLRAITVFTDREGVDHISTEYSNTYRVKVANPQVFYQYDVETDKYLVSISNGQTGISFRYTLDSTNPTATTGTLYESPIPLDAGDYTIKVIAYNTVAEAYYTSDNVTTINLSFAAPVTAHSYNDITNSAGTYILASDFSATGTKLSEPFTGMLDGQYHPIALTGPLFDKVNGGTIKNVVVSSVTINGGNDDGNAGAICNEASGRSRIYNCGVLAGSVSGSGSGSVGGIVGKISGDSRVINCYNYATISGGDYAAGIVGQNAGTASTGTSGTRVALCMMYGSMTTGTNRSPVYAGNHPSNLQSLTEYNFWRSKSGLTYTAYNDQLAIDKDEYLTRFPFYRHILNTHRELASYFLFGDYSENHVDEIGHWVLKRGENAPLYPVIEHWAEDTKKITVDLKNNVPNISDERKGKLLTTMGSSGYLTVNVYINGSKVASPQLPITDMNEDSYDYTWGKVVLPFANEFSGWTRDWKKVCTGWEITKVGSNLSSSVTKYNFADRDNPQKDIYDSNNPYIFAQGGNYIVPYGVTEIDITAHFANAFYLSDPSYEVGYNTSFGGTVYLGGNVPATYHGEIVYTDLATLVDNLVQTNDPHVQAIVLVGNFHYMITGANQERLKTNKAVTIMSADEDNNQEPDYGWYMGDTYGRLNLPPIRFDFVPIIELGMSSRVNNTTTYPGLGIWHTRGWFEQTETCVSFKSQCEITSSQFNAVDDGKGNNRWIVNSGYFIQIVRSKNAVCNRLSYIQIGGNAYVKELYPGNHTDNSFENTAVPIIVTGGQVDECYMTGYKTGGKLKGNIHFWCAGGKIKKFLGAYLDEPVSTETEPGNLTAHVDHALIGRFFGGGTSASARIKGNIDVTINNSQVDFYCGGPEFGDMYTGKIVTTHATNTTFGEFYGAGFGGTSITYNREAQDDNVSFANATAPYNLAFTNYTNNRLVYNSSYGIGSCYKFEYIFHSSGSKGVARFYTGYAKFSLAKTGNVTNILNDCKIKKLAASSTIINQTTSGDFYGAGCQGMVNGTVTSTLTGCEVDGSAFGGGYKADNNNLDVYPTTQPTYSVFTKETGIFSDFGEVAPTTYTWAQGTSEKKNTVEGTTLYTGTDVTLSDLGNVTGAISITVDGGTVAHNVFGGGNESKSLDNTSVTIQNGASISGDVFGAGKGKADDETVAYVTGGTTVSMIGGTVSKSVYGGGQLAQVGGDTHITVSGGNVGVANAQSYGAIVGNVYGGGMGNTNSVAAGLIKGNTEIEISGGTIYHNIYGGGAYGSVGIYTYDSSGNITDYTSGGTATINITGGTIGTTGKNNGMVFGSSRGDVDRPGAIHDRLAWVHDTHVTIGTSGQGSVTTTPLIKGSVYGSGENGHTYQNTIVDVHSGTIGIASGVEITNDNGTPEDTSDDITYSGAAYPYRGNVYGSGCGTDKYYDDPTGITDPYDGGGDTYNPLAGIVYGTTTVNIDGGLVVHNVYGAGAMGSVGKVESTTTNNVTTTTTTGGLTTINISGGTIGVSGTVGDGNVFGAARGDKDAVGNEEANHATLRLANVRQTSVNISNGSIIKGNVYGGGEVGSVGTYSVSTEGEDYMKIYTYESGTGACNVTINGGTIGTNVASVNGIFANGNVYGAGKGLANTFWCEKGMVYSTNVTINAGTVYGTVYGGGEVGRVENNSTVTIGVSNPEGTTPAPNITGNVFGAGAGIETHGYSALLRGDTEVTVQGNAHVGLSVYGGGEKASVGRFVVDKGVPKEPADDGSGDCTVTVQGNATIAGSVFGTGQGVTPHYYTDVIEYPDTSSMPKRMMAITMGKFDSTNQDYWQYVSDDDHNNVWEYLNTKQKYLDFLPTLALASHPVVNIGGNAAISGSVYGGGQRGITLGTVAVNMTGGTVTEDVYGGGALADTNKGNWDASGGTWAEGKSSAFFTTTVNLTGGKLRNAYGGGLGQIARAAGENVTALESIEARVYGDVLVELNNNNNGETANGEVTGCIVKRVFGCNNQNGTPMGHVKVHVYATQNADTEHYPIIKNKQALHTTAAGNLPETGSTSTYDVLAVYGGGNLSAYEPAGGKNTEENTEVIIDGCNLTSIKQVYGGGNAAPAPATSVRVNGTWEIEEVFGGGNGKDDYELYGKTYLNPGANVGYYNYTHPVWNSTLNKYETIDYNADDGDDLDASTKQKRIDNWSYGTGVARTEIAGGKIHYVYGASNERGNVCEVAISKYEEMDESCPMVIDETYGGGKNSIIDGRIDMGLGCVHDMDKTYGGSRDADVNSDIVLNITNGTYNKVFGGNNTSGNINGSITVNIYEDGCSPVRIGELYLGGYLADYSIYGYKADRSVRTKAEYDALSTAEKEAITVRKDPRINIISATRIDNVFGGGYEATVVGNPHVNVNMEKGKIKGEYNTTANPITTGLHEYTGNSNYNYTVESIDETTKDATLAIGTIGNIYGGGNMADIVGNTYVEIGTGFWLKEGTNDVWETKNAAGATYTYERKTGSDVWKWYDKYGEEATTTPTPARYTAKITGNIYGGGDNAAVQGNTHVNVCAVNADDPATTDVIEMTSVTLPSTIGNDVTIGGSIFGGGNLGDIGNYTKSGKDYNFDAGTGKSYVTIAGGTIGTQASPSDVFGGGQGNALESGDGAFMCEKAMVDYTNVVISNGTVNGTVYGGGKIGRVNHDTEVTIGLKREANATTAVSTPVVEKSVYGAGKGLSTHGYAALVRGNSKVTVQGDAKVKDCVYGGGEIASVGKYSLDAADMPQSLANNNSGYCTVIVQDNAEVGPDAPMSMITESGYPVDAGHVFGAGKGILPYDLSDLPDPTVIPWRVKGNNTKQQFGEGVYVYEEGKENSDYKEAYLTYIETLGLATQTYVTVAGNALVKGSVYGGSMNGHVQHDTNVTIAGGQIGCQKGTAVRLLSTVWEIAPSSVTEDYECDSWPYGVGENHEAPFNPYDIYDYQTGTTKPKSATDGHTFYGNVFGGGSGYYPYAHNPKWEVVESSLGNKSKKELGYADGLWHREAGSVGGNTVVNITGGHILTSVYGGNEQTDVGTYIIDANGDRIPIAGTGHCTINMNGGTIGVPRNPEQIKAHPVTCYVFGAGKGDPRINFNNWTNVASTQVNISGNARIYGSTFGGGEDGHVVRDAETNIGDSFTMTINGVETSVQKSNAVLIGSTGTSGADGNIFGGGRGFSEMALTAGVVGGCVRVNIQGGTMLGSVFGGGRLASVGTYFANAENNHYGEMQIAKTEKTLYTAEEAAAYNTMHNLTSTDAGYINAGDIKTPEITHGYITVTIDGGTIGATDGSGKLVASNFSIGDVFGGCKGSAHDVRFGTSKNTSVSISGAKTKINGNVYGGGESGDVGIITRDLSTYNYSWKNSDGANNTAGNNIENTTTAKNSGVCTVTISGGTIGDEGKTATKGNVFGAGKGSSETWWCEKAMAFATKVSISNATTVYGNVYGGGEIGRLEDDAKVIIGNYGGSDKPDIKGNVFGAGKGFATHGYSALLRGNTEVTVQGKAQVGGNVYGGGEIATVGKFWVTGVEYPAALHAPDAPTDLPDGMPYALRDGGTCTVTVQDNAEIAGDVFGAGMGKEPDEFDTHLVTIHDPDDPENPEKDVQVESYITKTASEVADIVGRMPRRMATYESYNSTTKKGYKDDDKNITWVPIDDEDNPTIVWEYFDTPEKYYTFLQTLAIVNHPIVTIDGSAEVDGSVYGGSESGFVLDETSVTIQGSCEIGTTTTGGNVFGGGKGLLSFAEAGRVRKNTNITINSGTIKGNVYGGGSMGDVGNITKPADYNYTWKQTDGSTPNVIGNNVPSDTDHDTSNNTGICTVEITGGTIGLASTEKPKEHGNVFGAGKGSEATWWCEKAMAFATDVTVKKSGSANTLVYGNVYGGGEIGRVGDDTKVTIGTADGSDEPDIKGSVYGAGAGKETHGYSALVRGNAAVTVQGTAKVGGSVYGGGEIASVGKFTVVKGLPTKPETGGTCTVTIQDNAYIGQSGKDHDVYGACKGVTPHYDSSTSTSYKSVYSMQTYENRPSNTPGDTWDYWTTYEDGYIGQKFIKRYYKTEPEYLSFLKTLALTSNTDVTISGGAHVYGDVYGGGQRGITLGSTDVNIAGGSVKQDVYGGGALADTNKGNWDDSQYSAVTLPEGHTLTDLYTRTGGSGTDNDPYTYSEATSSTGAEANTTYYSKGTWATGKYDNSTHATFYKTNVILTGGEIEGDVYGGGLGQIARKAVAAQPALSAVKAKVYGDVLVKLNEDTDNNDCKVHGNIFGCNNQNGSPQSAVTVHVYKTEGWTDHMRTGKQLTGSDLSAALNDPDDGHHSYELKGVYGGGNLSAFYPDLKATRDTVQAYVIIDGCKQTSIKQVYGGGNAAPTPATNITIFATYEIEEVFGGGNGKDDLPDGSPNPGANVGYETYPDIYDIPASSKAERTSMFSYGSGSASVTIYDGLIHRVFGGSNTKGNVRESAVTLLDDMSGCDFQIDEAYGGGKNAPMDAEAKLLMACIPGLKAAYGGAQEADVLGGVNLTITNGTYERIFGGNNISGTIQGPIVVNIEETGCRPIVIGELYGGGNLAGYSIYGYKEVGDELVPRESADDGEAVAGTPYPSPVINVKSFTSIGNIFGGGYGASAKMVGNPTVNVNVVKGKYAETYNGIDNVIEDNAKVVGSGWTSSTSAAGYDNGYPIPSHVKGAIGAINNVFGGGNEAEVKGTPHVNIGTLMGEPTTLVSKKIEDSEGHAPSDAEWTPSYAIMTVEGADIRGNVYGGGNNAPVTGNTDVQIGKDNVIKTYSFTSYSAESGGTAYSTGLAQTTGVTKNNLSEVVILTNGKYGEFVGNKYYVDPTIKTDGSERKQLMDDENHETGMWVAIKPFEKKKTYSFTSYSAVSGGTEYSTGTATATGNFKVISIGNVDTDCMQIQVLTNPGETSWEGKTFYVPANTSTGGTTRTQLYTAGGTPIENVWVSITE